ncbi:MAG: hypothetical protein FGM27_01650 [Candidatus Omnitrophica bacterium]|nr:hypothetical protein [Candidatus Omnitrophota bacterium]
MQITQQLSRPLLDRIQQEYQELFREIACQHTEDAAELRAFIQKKLRQMESVQVAMNYYLESVSSQTSEDPFDLRETLRQHKLELRFARRRWKRQLVSQEKNRRYQERAEHVPTFAA